VDDVVEIVPVSRQNQELPAKRIKIVGDIVHDVVPTPAQVNFGPHPCGTAEEDRY
jgi:hypothetical protein